MALALIAGESAHAHLDVSGTRTTIRVHLEGDVVSFQGDMTKRLNEALTGAHTLDAVLAALDADHRTFSREHRSVDRTVSARFYEAVHAVPAAEPYVIPIPGGFEVWENHMPIEIIAR